ncbi:MAG: hypothetical protein EOP61_41910, partial [Sphingomonadales bacterium]
MPVKIRDGSGDVIARGVTGMPIAVPEGRYYATVLLPDGHEVGVQDAISVSSGGDERCTAGACSVERQPQFDSVEAPPMMAPAPAPTAQAAPAPEASTIEATIWRGSWHNLWDGDDSRVRIVPDVPVTLS